MIRQACHRAAHFSNEVPLIGTVDSRVVEASLRTPSVSDHAASAYSEVRTPPTDWRGWPLLPEIAIECVTLQKVREVVMDHRPRVLELVGGGISNLQCVVLIYTPIRLDDNDSEITGTDPLLLRASTKKQPQHVVQNADAGRFRVAQVDSQKARQPSFPYSIDSGLAFPYGS